MSIAVLGAGAFGTALAISLARNGAHVTLWARSNLHVAAMRDTRENAARLPGAPFPETLSVTNAINNIQGCSLILVAVPMQQLGAFADAQRAHLDGKTLVACCKGIDLATGLGPVAILNAAIPDAQTAILTGPSFAHDIAKGLPTALTLASQSNGARLQEILTTSNIRVYRSEDVIGAELGGALKNVIAIACGAAIGAKLGDSARAALITRGYAEMQRMALAAGASPETLAGLSGFGDLVLTCTSEGSRNFRYGLSIGTGQDFDPSVTVEGAATAKACLTKANAMKIDMPITRAVTALIDKTITVDEALTALLARPLKEETC